MLSCFWDRDGIIMTHYLEQGHTITGNYDSALLAKLRSTLAKKRRGKLQKGILLLPDNAPAHRSMIALHTSMQCSFKILPNPTYSPGAGFMKAICAGVSPNFGRKSSAPGRKSKKAESFGFMSGAQEILQGLLRSKVTPKNSRSISRCARANQQTKWRFRSIHITVTEYKRKDLYRGQIHSTPMVSTNFFKLDLG